MIKFLFKLFGFFDTSPTLLKIIVCTIFIIFWLCLTIYATVITMKEEQQQKRDGVDTFERVSVFGTIILMLCIGGVVLIALTVVLSSKPIMIIVGVIILIFLISKMILCINYKNQNKDKGIKYKLLSFLKRRLS